MSKARTGFTTGLLITVLVLLPFRGAQASNGMNLIGFGAVSISMGGADLAVTDSAAAMNINPAGIGWCIEPQLDIGAGFFNPSLTHTDMLGNNEDDSLDRVPVPFIGYVHPVGDLTLGIGMFFQGGLGVEYKNLVTPFAAIAGSGMFPPGFFGRSELPMTDTVKTELAHAKFTPALAWRANEKVTLGATLNVSYAQAEMMFLPETSLLADFNMSGIPGDAPGEMFAGLHIDGVSTWAYGLRLGLQYKDGPLQLGFSYSTETDLEFDGGTMTMNLTALGLGKVRYDAMMKNFAWPQQAGGGFGYRINPKWLVAADLDWINWSSAIETITITATNPDHPMAPPSREVMMPMGWDDQWVYAIGFEVNPNDDWTIRFGFNHGDTPIRAELSRPQFPAIAEDHVTAGFGYSSGQWVFDVGFEYVPEAEMTNNNPDMSLNPFGPGSTETLSQFAAYLTLRRVF